MAQVNQNCVEIKKLSRGFLGYAKAVPINGSILTLCGKICHLVAGTTLNQFKAAQKP
jgi:hypothetical protein